MKIIKFGGSSICDAERIKGANMIIKEKRADANRRSCSLMFVARYESGKAKIGIEEIPSSHPFYSLSGNDNIVSLTTRSLYRQPLVY